MNSAGSVRYYKQQGEEGEYFGKPQKTRKGATSHVQRKGGKSERLSHAAPAPKSNRLATFFAPGISSYPLPFRFIPLLSSALFIGAPISSGGRARGASSAVGFGSFRVGVGRGREEKNGCERDCVCRAGMCMRE